MARHPGTEGNDLNPRRVDCEQDVTVAGASIADAASGVFIQSDEPTDPPNGARWTDTSTQPPRTKIYDDSSSAFIPINAGDRTFVQDTEPDDLIQGDIWFNTSAEDGTDMLWFDGSSLRFLQVIPIIPDVQIHQWKMDEGQGETVGDSISNADAVNNGAEWITGDYTGGFALKGDGDSSEVKIGELNTIEENILGDFAAAFTITTTEDAANDFFANDTASFGDERFELRHDSGELSVIIEDADTDRIHIDTTNGNFNDGEKHRIFLNKTGNSATDISVFLNGSQLSTEILSDEDFDSKPNYNEFYFFSRGGGANHDGVLDNFIIFDDSLTESQIQKEFNNQPWS